MDSGEEFACDSGGATSLACDSAAPVATPTAVVELRGVLLSISLLCYLSAKCISSRTNVWKPCRPRPTTTTNSERLPAGGQQKGYRSNFETACERPTLYFMLSKEIFETAINFAIFRFRMKEGHFRTSGNRWTNKAELPISIHLSAFLWLIKVCGQAYWHPLSYMS
jgi:hypothetical protein